MLATAVEGKADAGCLGDLEDEAVWFDFFYCFQ